MKERADRASRSLILTKLMRLIEKIYRLLIHGFLGKLFTSYSAEEEHLYKSGFFSRLRNAKKSEQLAGQIKLRMARAFENSRVLAWIDEITASLIYRKLRTFGAFLLSLGSYGVIACLIQRFALGDASSDTQRLFVCATMLFISLPLISSRDTLAEALLNSKLLSPILFDGLGFSRDTFTKKMVFPKRYALVTALGMIFGVLTVFIDPIYYIVAALSMITVMIIFRYPEIGVVGWIALVPFVGFLGHGTLVLALIVLVTAVSYLIKFIRGKRSFRMKLIDYPVLLFAAIYFFGGIFSKGGKQSFYAALMYIILLFGYFLTFNLIRTRQWIGRCVIAAVVSGTAACLIGVVQIFTGTLESSWLDAERFSGIQTRIVSSFQNPNVFAEYLLLLIPFALSGLLKKGKKQGRMLYGFSIAVMLTCLVFTWSRGAWLGFLVGMLLFFLIFSKKSVVGFLGLLLVSPFLSWLVPKTVAERFISIGNFAESSVSYRISAWHGVVELLKKTWFCGIGVGNAAFEAAYPSVAVAGIETIEHAHSIYLQLLTELGITGLLVFALILFLFVQNCFEYLMRVKNQEERELVIAGMASIAGMLVMGITDHIWYSYPIFLVFWTVMALVNSAVKYGFSVFDRYQDFEKNTQYAAVLEIGTEEL